MLAVFLFGLNVLHLYGTACSRHLFSNRSTLNGVNENTKSDDTENNACKVLTPYEIADIWNASFMSNWICASYVQAMCKLFLSHTIEKGLRGVWRKINSIVWQANVCFTKSSICRHSHRTRML